MKYKMKTIVVLALLACARAATLNPCDDLAVSCADFRTAQGCGALPACLSQHRAALQASAQDQTCDWCRFVMQYASEQLSRPEVQHEILILLEHACMLIHNPDISSQCILTMEDSFSKVLQVVMPLLNPATCLDLGWCPDGDGVISQAHGYLLIPQKIVGNFFMTKRSAWNETSQSENELECIVCKNLVVDLKTILSDPHNKQFFRNILWRSCNCIYSPYRIRCMKLVEYYLDMGLDLIATVLEPDVVCTNFEVCGQQSALNLANVEPRCLLCHSLVTKAQDVANNASESEQIEDMLKAICEDLPDNLVERCQQFVHNHTELVGYLLSKRQDPLDVCFVLNLCSSQAYSALGALLSAEVPKDHCEWCQAVVTRMQGSYRQHRKEITKLADDACETYDTQCHELLGTYGSRIHKDLSKGMEPGAICTGFCSALTFNIRCTEGPLYWCSSRQSAAECNAAPFCQQNLWSRV